MFSTKLYKLAKRNDSTKRPTTIGVEYQCTLKENTGLINPVFRFRYSPTQQIFAFNYMYIDAFDRFYFINDWEFAAGEWIAYCTIDPLATYKNEISELTATIERSSNYLYYDERIPDSFAILSSGVGIRHSKISSLLSDFANDPTDGGFFVVGINNGEAITGAVAYYLLTFKAFYQTVNFLMKQNPFDWKTTLNNKANPLQYINSIYWCPLKANQFTDYQPISSIVLFQNSIGSGNVSLQLDPEWGQCFAVFNEDDEQKGLIKYLQYQIRIPALSVPEWIATTSFRYTLTAPYSGTIDLPAEFIGKNSATSKTYYLNYKIQLDTGDAIVAISTTPGTSYSTFYDNIIFSINTRVGSNVLYGERQSNIGDVLFKSMSSLVGSVASGTIMPTNTPKASAASAPATKETGVVPYTAPVGPYTGGSSGGSSGSSFSLPAMTGFNTMGSAMGLLSAIGSFSSNTITRGSSPTYLESLDYIHLTIYEREQINQYDVSDLGVQCETVAKIADIADMDTYESTFIKCRTAHVDFNCLAVERNMIESFLLNGFHFERDEQPTQ